MCWVCNPTVKAGMANNYWANFLGVEVAHFEAASSGNWAALDIDGDGIASLGGETLVVTTDDAADSIATDRAIVVNAPSIISTIDTVGDQDFFKVEFEAGKTYQIGQYAYVGGPSGVPLSDAYIEIFDSAGNLVVSADGGGPNTPSGLDALMTFVAEEGGTYYINARSYDNAAENGTTGDEIGDYELFVNEVDPNDPTVYRPYYEVDSPLYALDWGSQVDGTVRNPDGAESGHITGNPQETPDTKGEMVDGKNVIKIYFAKAGDVYSPEDPTSPGLPPAIIAVGAKDFEIEAVWTALGEFEKVADVVYVETQNRDDADFHYVTYSGTPGPGVSLLGSMSPPNESDEGLAQFNSGDYRWNATNLAQGGFSFVTLIHEFGHGHGMSHPHDNGGQSGIMNGVEEESAFNYTTGEFELNQGVHTMMSYEDGWQSSPYGNAKTDVGYGYLGGLMAFDIAVIQDKYGVNEEWAKGNNVYQMKDENAVGTFFSSIWDGGGKDTILYTGARDTTIDLRAASLKYEAGGGGNVSFANGIFGGYTIANGVTIERAASGAGNDKLIGNDADNYFGSGAGNDMIVGGLGRDTIDGGTGIDTMEGGAGADIYVVRDQGDRIVEAASADVDVVRAYSAYTLDANVDQLRLYGDAREGVGNDLDNLIVGSHGNDTLSGLSGKDSIYGGAGMDIIFGGDDVDNIFGGFGNDTLNGDGGDDFIRGGEKGNDTLNGGSGDDVLHSGEAADVLNGGNGNDQLLGGTQRDTLTGGTGADIFLFADGDLSNLRSQADRILDFNHAEGDKIHLRQMDANSGVAGDQNFTFIGASAFTAGTAGQLRSAQSNGFTYVEGDTNGDGVADFSIRLDGLQNLVAADFVV